MPDDGAGRPLPDPIVILTGPAGCGKTTVGPRLATALGVAFVDGDDLHDAASTERMRRGEPLDDAARGPWLDRIAAAIDQATAAGHGLVVACSALRQVYRDRLAAGRAPRFVQLDAPAEVLRARLAARRGHFFPAALLDSQLRTLEPLPAGARVDATAAPDAIVAAIAALLRR